MMKKFDLKKLTSSRELSLVVVLIVLCIFVQMRNSVFLQSSTIEAMFKNYAVVMILALGMMCVLLIGGIDISIGSVLAFSGMASALLMRDHPGIPVIGGFLLSMLFGTLLGFVIGLVIAKGKVLPIVATLGFMNIYRGLTYLIANSQWVAAYQIPEGFKNFAQSRYLSGGLINNMIVVTIVVYVIFFIVMKWTTLGRKVYAVGSNPEAAELSGINIDNVRLGVYTLMGLLSGLGGALWVSLYASAQGDMATGLEMDVIAACVVGGVSMNGGRGSVVGVFLGALTMSIIGKALPLIGVSQFWQNGIKGLIILIAVILNVIAQRTMDKNNLKGREL
ncbi:MAG: ABC transporter permease [Lachnospiraceae bacterium]